MGVPAHFRRSSILPRSARRRVCDRAQRLLGIIIRRGPKLSVPTQTEAIIMTAQKHSSPPLPLLRASTSTIDDGSDLTLLMDNGRCSRYVWI